ncbi:MAG: DUF2520 domain-containing protein [Myxococcota bacterium]
MSERVQRVFLIGTGSAGTALGLWLSRRGHRLVGAWNRSVRRARTAEEALSIPVGAEDWPTLPDCDVVLVAVSDGAIAEVGERLRPHLRPGMVVAHTSGSLPASALGEQSVPRGSVHPLVAMRSPEIAADALNRAMLTVEGDADAVARLSDLVEGARVQRLEAKDKTVYHAAAVIASNLAVALVAEAAELASSVGIHDAERALAELSFVAIENVLERGTAAGLTGPVSRGDVDTVRAHLGALKDPTRKVYRELSLRALELARVRGLESEKVHALQTVLRDERLTG